MKAGATAARPSAGGPARNAAAAESHSKAAAVSGVPAACFATAAAAAETAATESGAAAPSGLSRNTLDSPSLAACCSRGVNVVFSCIVLVGAILGGILYGLDPSHWLHIEARKLLASLPAAAAQTPDSFRLASHMSEAAALLQQQGLSGAAAYVSAVASWKYVDAAAFVSVSLLSLLLVFVLVRAMLDYRRERQVEVSPPAVRYCCNQMTLEEYNNKETTYAAVAELMSSPEFLALKAKRAALGSDVWNWQRRQETETVSECDVSGDSGDEQGEEPEETPPS